jgi:hypothetical protein
MRRPSRWAELQNLLIVVLIVPIDDEDEDDNEEEDLYVANPHALCE